VITEPSRKIPVYGNYDVIVCGGGPAGIASAVAAARNKTKVLLIEQTGALGGMAAGGLVPCFCPYSNSKTPLISGIGFEILERLKIKNGVGKDVNSINWVAIDSEKLKTVCDDLVQANKISLLLFSSAVNIIKKKNQINGIVIENKSGRSAVLAQMFIDATGDADIAFHAGAEYEKGGIRGELQPATLCCYVSGIRHQMFFQYLKKTGGNFRFTSFLREEETKGKIKKIPGAEYRLMAVKEIQSNLIGFNFGHIFSVDGTKTEDQTKAMVTGRRLLHEFIAYARKNIPGCGDARIVSTGSLPGIRETRRLRGKYQLTADDFTHARSFPDNIAVYAYPIDVHNANRSTREVNRIKNEFESTSPGPGRYYGIPFRSLMTNDISNLLIAGRSVSADRQMHGSVRVMPACFAMGQAAGTAAALCVKYKTIPENLDIALLQRQLVRQGARIK